LVGVESLGVFAAVDDDDSAVSKLMLSVEGFFIGHVIAGSVQSAGNIGAIFWKFCKYVLSFVQSRIIACRLYISFVLRKEFNVFNIFHISYFSLS
jgi:hypothetical protein